eukprot:TRINITY_DN4909_c0_g1_i1.p1 TRINITY_DN4909_c0_g1~~TRINITY_DN4909_c0_g1_i1.p1  ORF type:complete len:224 (+),score=54.32 TRINITY_DN4909_c0_g1_i1:93-674(+)
MGAELTTMIITSDKKAYFDAPSSWAYSRMQDARSWYAAFSEDDDNPHVSLNGGTIREGCEFDGVKKVKTQQQKTSGNYRTTWIEMKDVNVNLRLEECRTNEYVKFWGKESWAETDAPVGDAYFLEFRINSLSANSCEVEVTMTFSNSNPCIAPCIVICGSCIKNAARGKLRTAMIKLKTNLDRELHTGVQKMR